MSETQTTQPELEKIAPEEIARLLEKAKDTEWKFLLKLRTWARQGTGWHTDYAEFNILFGEAEEVVLERWDAGYPYSAGEDVLIIPKTVPVVVLWEHVSDDNKTATVYIFTKDGWKEVEVY